jgi:muramoyltetrapeptide carboxypeptidase
MIPRTACGLLKCRPVRSGSRVALVAPASPFAPDVIESGAAELRRLGLEPVFDERIFERQGFVAGSASSRAAELASVWRRREIDAIISVRGGYGSVHVLPLLDLAAIRESRTLFVGYSDVTSLHVALGCLAGLTSVYGAMIEGRISVGPAAYDVASFLGSLSSQPLGELTPDGLEVIRPGEASGPLFGGTLTQLLASFRTPFEFKPPSGHVLVVDEVGERPYRLHRMLTQYRLSGLLALSCAVVFGQLPGCDEPTSGGPGARDVIAEIFADYPGPVILGFPAGHTTTPLVSLPLGVEARVIAGKRTLVAIEEAATGE